MKVGIFAAATLVGAVSLLTVSAHAQGSQTLVTPPAAIARAGALPQATLKSEARSAVAEGSITPAVESTMALPPAASVRSGALPKASPTGEPRSAFMEQSVAPSAPLVAPSAPTK
jgi:hypothetical protein